MSVDDNSDHLSGIDLASQCQSENTMMLKYSLSECWAVANHQRDTCVCNFCSKIPCWTAACSAVSPENFTFKVKWSSPVHLWFNIFCVFWNFTRNPNTFLDSKVYRLGWTSEPAVLEEFSLLAIRSSCALQAAVSPKSEVKALRCAWFVVSEQV